MKPESRGDRDSVQEGNSMQSQATLPSQSSVWGILPLRFESELAAQKLEIWRLGGLSEEFAPIGNNSTGECAGREIIAWFARQLEASIHEPRRATLDVVRRALEGAGC